MKDVTGILGLAARARKTATGEIVYTQLRARHVHAAFTRFPVFTWMEH